ncbi:flagellin N-terminal helical domain-containing protein [Rubripirellula reticaptiva]|uniref:Flagellin n=1 Tax=Rubripirellula reticaptiva TaxID=2528013 RepID=A0A5C6EDI3_9BACT|nr:flagellin [Rubripirellula reticaptiva]TWU47092.1 A-type flagellin [Rubripirellula reticaptiva]
MTRINTNVSSLVAQNRLQSSNKDLNSALTRLSTGLRINSGADDPAGLIASESLRSEINGLGKAISNTERASQIISTADSALGQVSNLLNDVRGLVVEAANSGALSKEEIAANQLQLDSSLEAINRIAQTTTFQGRKLLDGSLDFVSKAGTGAENLQSLSIDQASLGTTGKVSVDINVSAAATKAAVAVSGITAVVPGTDAVDPVAGVASSADFTVGTETVTITADATGVAGDGPTITFDDSTDTGAAPSASVDGSGNITITVDDDTAYTAAELVTALDGIAGYSAATDGAGTETVTGALATGTLAGGVDEVVAAAATDATGGLAEDVVFELQGSNGSEVFNIKAGSSIQQIRDQINLVKDATGVEAEINADGTTLDLSSAGYGKEALIDVRVLEQEAGGNFTSTRTEGTDIVATVNGRSANGDGNKLSVNTSTLDLSTSVKAGFTGTASFEINGGGAKFQLGPDAVGNQQARVGISSVSTARLGGTSGKLYQLGSGESADLSTDPAKAAEIVSEAIDQVTSLRGRLGAFQSTTLDSNLVSLKETKANLQEAESSIRDADFAQESANLTRAQILVQSGTNVLSLANQNPQNVLSLLR